MSNVSRQIKIMAFDRLRVERKSAIQKRRNLNQPQFHKEIKKSLCVDLLSVRVLC